MRTDLLFERNRDELRQYRRGPWKWVSLLVLILLLAGGAWLYHECVRESPGELLRRMLPWLSSKGRALMGRDSLRSLIAVIERSGLPDDEKKGWRTYLDEQWTFAGNVGGDVLKQEDLIDFGRAVVESKPGLHYALRWVGDQDLSRTSLNDVQRKAAQRLIGDAADAIRDGRCSPEQAARARALIHLAVADLWPGGASELEKKAGIDADRNFKDLLGVLHGIGAGGKPAGESGGTDPAAELRQELSRFKEKIEQAKASAGKR